MLCLLTLPVNCLQSPNLLSQGLLSACRCKQSLMIGPHTQCCTKLGILAPTEYLSTRISNHYSLHYWSTNYMTIELRVNNKRLKIRINVNRNITCKSVKQRPIQIFKWNWNIIELRVNNKRLKIRINGHRNITCISKTKNNSNEIEKLLN